jgi:hypothetical protein
MCSLIGGTANLEPGWMCCQCRCYNGLWRPGCKNCAHGRCAGSSETQVGVDLPNPVPVELISSQDATLIAKDLRSAGEAIERILLRLEGMASLEGRSLVEVLQAILTCGAVEQVGDVFSRLSEIAARLPIMQEVQTLGLGALAGMNISSLKH